VLRQSGLLQRWDGGSKFVTLTTVNALVWDAIDKLFQAF
jgi:hypothetical protein